MSEPLVRAVAEIVRVLDRSPRLVNVLSPSVARVLIEPDKLAPLDALVALDELGFTLRRWVHRADLTPALDAARGTLAPSLAKDHAMELAPSVAAVPRSLSSLPPGTEIVAVPWPAPAETVVVLEKRGQWMPFRKAFRVTPRAHVASGEARSMRLDVLEAALVAIEAASPSREDHERLLRLIDDCERDDPRANSEAAVRFAVGCIERAKAIPKARAVALDFLASSGIAPIALDAGAKWDADKHPASAFERKRVKGPAGRVVATETTGFKDAKGVVLSRAVVAVGEG